MKTGHENCDGWVTAPTPREQFDAWIETCPVEWECMVIEHDGEPGEKWYFFRIPKDDEE